MIGLILEIFLSFNTQMFYMTNRYW